MGVECGPTAHPAAAVAEITSAVSSVVTEANFVIIPQWAYLYLVQNADGCPGKQGKLNAERLGTAFVEGAQALSPSRAMMTSAVLMLGIVGCFPNIPCRASVKMSWERQFEVLIFYWDWRQCSL